MTAFHRVIRLPFPVRGINASFVGEQRHITSPMIVFLELVRTRLRELSFVREAAERQKPSREQLCGRLRLHRIHLLQGSIPT